jgi:hypothetical protein
MPESWFELSSADQAEALEVAAGRSGRPAYLLEKDIWGVWVAEAGRIDKNRATPVTQCGAVR